MPNLIGCNFTETTIQVTTIIDFFTIYVLLPYNITIGLLFNVLLAIALLRQTKIKITYGYQLQLACSRTLYSLSFGWYLACGNWLIGSDGYKGQWFMRQYWLMVVNSKILVALINMTYLLSLLLSVAITCDRVFALAWPYRYKAVNHRRLQSVVAVVLITIAGALTIDKYFAFNIVEVMDPSGTVFYQSQANPAYVSTTWGRTSESVRVYVRALCLVLLLASNVSMIVLHRRRIKRIESMTISNEERIQARRETNKDLTILAACQSILSVIDHVVNMAAQLLWQSSAYWAKCSYVVAAYMNCTMMLAGIAEFFLFVVVNRRLRLSIPGFKFLSKANRVGTTVGQ